MAASSAVTAVRRLSKSDADQTSADTPSPPTREPQPSKEQQRSGLLSMDFPDEPPTPRSKARGTLAIGQAVSSGTGGLGAKEPADEPKGKEKVAAVSDDDDRALQAELAASKADAKRLAAEVERLQKQLRAAAAAAPGNGAAGKQSLIFGLDRAARGLFSSASTQPSSATVDAKALASIDEAVERGRAAAADAKQKAKVPKKALSPAKETTDGKGQGEDKKIGGAPAEEWRAAGWLG